MKAMPTIPKPTTTTFFRCDGALGYLFASFSSSECPFGGSLLTAMPGDEVAQDMFLEQLCVRVLLPAARECTGREMENEQLGCRVGKRSHGNLEKLKDPPVHILHVQPGVLSAERSSEKKITHRS